MPGETNSAAHEPRRRIDRPDAASHAAEIAENLRRIAAALPPLPLRIAVPAAQPEPASNADHKS